MLSGPDGATAKARYAGLLTSPAWIMKMRGEQRHGNWPDAPWQLFHHAVKLKALGATDADVTDVLRRLEQGGIAMPVEVNARTWQDNHLYRNDPPLTWQDIRDAGAQLNAPSCWSVGVRQMFSYTTTEDGMAIEFVKTTKYLKH